jgi:hypothetical protein
MKESNETIKFIEEITIDNEKRVGCKMKEWRTLAQWKLWACTSQSPSSQ